MNKPAAIATDVMDVAASIEKDIPSRISGANRVFIRAVIARAIMAEREACAEMAELVGIPMAANGQPILMIPVQIAKRIRNRSE